jgi:hypothetical protein
MIGKNALIVGERVGLLLVSAVSVMGSAGYMSIVILSLHKKTKLFNLTFFKILKLARSLIMGRADSGPLQWGFICFGICGNN